jgi:hypothetical protein
MSTYSRKIAVNSANRSSGTPEDLVVYLGETIQRIIAIKLVHFSFFNTIYNVTSSNNVLTYTYSATNYTATIPPGAYDITSLMAAAVSALNASGSGVTFGMTYSSTTLKITITADSSVMFIFGDGSPWMLLGHTQGSIPTGTSIVAPNVADISAPNQLYLNIREFPANIHCANATSDRPTFIIPLGDSKRYYSEFNGNENFDQTFKLDAPMSIDKLSIQLKCDAHDGGPATNAALNGSNYNCLIEFTCKD